MAGVHACSARHECWVRREGGACGQVPRRAQVTLRCMEIQVIGGSAKAPRLPATSVG